MVLTSKKIIGESFDGAANMCGEFNGLHTHISKEIQKVCMCGVTLIH